MRNAPKVGVSQLENVKIVLGSAIGTPAVTSDNQERDMRPYCVVEYDSGPEGMEGMEALINEMAAEGYALLQVIERSTYRWVLIFKREPDQA